MAALTLIRLAIIPMKMRPPAIPKRPDITAQSAAEKIIKSELGI